MPTDSPRTAPDRTDRRCQAVVEQPDDGPPICTIYSIAREDSLVTAWLSARADAFCDLEGNR
ncbi:MAG: hypothetical protein PPP58_04690 [Natronomonas sp.]